VGFFETVEVIVGVEDGRRVGTFVGGFVVVGENVMGLGVGTLVGGFVVVGENVVGLKEVGELVRVFDGEITGRMVGSAEGDLEDICVGFEVGEAVFVAFSLRFMLVLCIEEDFTAAAAVIDLMGNVNDTFLIAFEALALNCE